MNVNRLSSESVAAEFRAAMARQQITTADLATRTGRTPMWLSRRLRGLTPMSVDDVDELARALEVTVHDVLGLTAP